MPLRSLQASPFSLWEGLACETSVSGNSLFVSFTDSELVAVAILWRLSTPTVGVNCLGLREAMHLQSFPPTRYVMGGATRVLIRDDLYPI